MIMIRDTQFLCIFFKRSQSLCMKGPFFSSSLYQTALQSLYHFIFRYSLFIIYLFILPFLNVFQSVFFFSPSILHFSLSSIWFGVDRCLDVIYWRVCYVNIVRAQSIPNQSQKYFYYDKIEIRVDRDIRLMYGTLSMVSCQKKIYMCSEFHIDIATFAQITRKMYSMI